MRSTRHLSLVDSTSAVAVSPRRILIVDDSRLQRKILSSSLKRWGFAVVEAANGFEALEMCKEHMPDIVISDWMMPGMSGPEFCREFRELSGNSYGYFILLTSKSETTEVVRGLEAGADDFLIKPVNAHELRARIMAGERILKMQRELTRQNTVISETLGELQRLYDSLDSDLLEAKKLQQSLVPERFKTFDNSSLSLLLRSSGHVGGDLVGYFPVDEKRMGLFAIDVSGHGISSALMTARLAGYLSGSALDQNVALRKTEDGRFVFRPPAQAIEKLNELVLDEMETEHYFTFMLADVDLETGRIAMGQAGHPHPVILRKDGRIEQGGSGGFPVGLMSSVEFSQFEVILEPGDRLLILSDGVIECPNHKGEMLGEEGLEDMLKDLGSSETSTLLEVLVWQLSDFAGSADFPDDVSGILFEYTGPA